MQLPQINNCKYCKQLPSVIFDHRPPKVVYMDIYGRGYSCYNTHCPGCGKCCIGENWYRLVIEWNEKNVEDDEDAK